MLIARALEVAGGAATGPGRPAGRDAARMPVAAAASAARRSSACALWLGDVLLLTAGGDDGVPRALCIEAGAAVQPPSVLDLAHALLLGGDAGAPPWLLPAAGHLPSTAAGNPSGADPVITDLAAGLPRAPAPAAGQRCWPTGAGLAAAGGLRWLPRSIVALCGGAAAGQAGGSVCVQRAPSPGSACPARRPAMSRLRRCCPHRPARAVALRRPRPSHPPRKRRRAAAGRPAARASESPIPRPGPLHRAGPAGHVGMA